MIQQDAAIEQVLPPITRTIRGVFKGGGAKGVVYAGALYELRARGIWFESVAGSSAGAITAVLIAAGLSPDEMLSVTSEGLQTLRRKLFRVGPLFPTDRLIEWLNGVLADRLHLDSGSGPVTFAQLAAVGPGIDLNVVAMDLATREPIVFNASITPEVPIAEAAAGSSAIPVAMPSRRIRVGVQDAAEIHRVVDGGTYANYPAFVYKDESFRAFFGLPAIPPEGHEDTVGFAIEPGPVDLSKIKKIADVNPPVTGAAVRQIRILSQRSSRFDLGTGRRVFPPWGPLLAWSWLRWVVLGFGAMLTVGVSGYAWISLVTSGAAFDSPLPAPVDAIVHSAALILMLLVFVFLLVWLLFAVRLLPGLVDVGLPSALAMMSVNTGVPRWAGAAEGDKVIRLSAPLGVKTTTFDMSEPIRHLSVAIAGRQADSQLTELFPGQARAPVPRLSDRLPGGDITTLIERQREYERLTTRRPLTLNPALADDATFWGAFWWFALVPLPYLANDWLSFLVASVIAIVGVTTGLWRLLLGRIRNQSLDERDPVRRRWALLLVGGGTLLVAAGAVLATGQLPGPPPKPDEFDGPFRIVLYIYGVFALVLTTAVIMMSSAVGRYFANRAADLYRIELDPTLTGKRRT